MYENANSGGSGSKRITIRHPKYGSSFQSVTPLKNASAMTMP
jgi:hypothetical protein